MLVDVDGDVGSDADADAGLDSVSIASSLELSCPVLAYPLIIFYLSMNFGYASVFSPCNCK
jgi:hypothetical protein